VTAAAKAVAAVVFDAVAEIVADCRELNFAALSAPTKVVPAVTTEARAVPRVVLAFNAVARAVAAEVAVRVTEASVASAAVRFADATFAVASRLAAVASFVALSAAAAATVDCLTTKVDCEVDKAVEVEVIVAWLPVSNAAWYAAASVVTWLDAVV
jgi:hypothetical protein